MTERSRRLDLRLVLLLAFVVAAIWAATALAGGSQPASGDAGGSNGPESVFVQTEDDGGGAPRSGEDCPERDGGGDGSGGTPDV